MVANYHKDLLRVTSEAIERFPAQERDISAMVLSISSTTMTEIKKRIDRFRNEIVELVRNDTCTDRVINMNIQMFPVSNRIEKG